MAADKMNLPEDMSALREAAVSLHEMYLAFRTGGFTENEAIRLVAAIITSTPMPQNNDE